MKQLPFLLSLVFLVSCVTDVTDKYASLAVEKLVVNCFFSPENSWELYLSKTISLGQIADSSIIVKDAEVFVYENGEVAIPLLHEGNGKYTSPLHPKNGAYYRLEITSDEFPFVTATDSVAPFIGIEAITCEGNTKTFPGIGYQGEKYYTYNVKFDFANKKDIYLSCQNYYEQDTIAGIKPFWNTLTLTKGFFHASTDEAILFAPNPIYNIIEVYINDYTVEYRNGNLMQFYEVIPTTANPLNYEEVRYVVYMQYSVLTEAAYQYQYDYIKQVHDRGNPFIQHTPVYSNINGGLGIFASARSYIVPTIQTGKLK